MKRMSRLEASRLGVLARPPERSPVLGASSSATITAARILCILFMTSTHAWPGAERVLAVNAAPVTQAFYFVLVEVLGRASVPLLSLLSGILFAASFCKRPAASVIGGKARTLLIPMVAWSLPMLALLYAEGLLTGTGQPQWGGMAGINAVFSLTAAPANGPLHFLRDMFVASLYGCAILRLHRSRPALGVALAVALALLEQKAGGFLLFRNQIAVFFVAGLLLAMHGRSNWRPSAGVVAVALAGYGAVWLAGWSALAEPNLLQQRLGELVPRAAVSLLMWWVAFQLCARAGRLSARLARLEPHIFVIFCSHYLLVKPFGLVAALTGWSEASAWHPLALLGQMAAFVVAGVALSRLLEPFPWLRGKGGWTARAGSAAWLGRGPRRGAMPEPAIG